MSAPVLLGFGLFLLWIWLILWEPPPPDKVLVCRECTHGHWVGYPCECCNCWGWKVTPEPTVVVTTTEATDDSHS